MQLTLDTDHPLFSIRQAAQTAALVYANYFPDRIHAHQIIVTVGAQQGWTEEKVAEMLDQSDRFALSYFADDPTDLEPSAARLDDGPEPA